MKLILIPKVHQFLSLPNWKQKMESKLNYLRRIKVAQRIAQLNMLRILSLEIDGRKTHVQI